MNYEIARAVNSVVNSQTTYLTDWQKHGVQDFWECLPAGLNYADCDDYAMTKRQRFLDMGIDPKELRLAICYTETNEQHMVLVVTTDRGEFVLDNRYPEPVSRDELDYKWVQIQEGKRWYELS